MPRLDQRLGLTRFEADEAYKRALDAYKKGDFDNAMDAIDLAIEALPKHAEYYAVRGLIFLEDGDTPSATADLEYALYLYKYELLAHYGLGMIAYKQAHKNKDADTWDTALKHFSNALKADPNRAETLYYLALVSYYRGDNANAVNYMVRAQAAFEAAGDKRKSSADRWIREFQKLVDRTQALLNPQQQPLSLNND